MQALAFQNTEFDIVDRNGQPWLRSPQIAEALGYSQANRVTDVYNRNADEFTTSMTAIVKLQDLHPQSAEPAQTREVRIFSLRGAHLLGMLSRTKKAKEFRAWVLDVLEGIAEAPAKPQRRSKPRALPNGLTTEQQDAIKAMVKARVESLPQEKRAKGAITCWSALKSKFGCTYKEIPAEHFTDAASLVARVELEGEWLPKQESESIVMLDAHTAQHVYLLMSRIASMNKHRDNLGRAARALNSEPLLSVYSLSLIHI